MSTVEIRDAGWQAIMADERLAGARRKLSFHEIRLIVDHARSTPPLDSEAVERIVTAIGVLRDEEGDPLNQYFTKAELNEIATAALTAMKEDDRGEGMVDE